MVHQHFMLVPVFTVTENIMLGNETVRGITLDRRAAAKPSSKSPSSTASPSSRTPWSKTCPSASSSASKSSKRSTAMPIS